MFTNILLYETVLNTFNIADKVEPGINIICNCNIYLTTESDIAPTVVQGLDKDYNFVDNETNIRLTCKWEGQPAPTVEW